MKLHEFVDAFTANLAHEISDLGGSAATARTTISHLLQSFRDDLIVRIDGLDGAIADVLAGHADKANALAEAAREGRIVQQSADRSLQHFDPLADDDGAAELARKLAPRRAA
jgi:hypothetical protein